MTELPPRSRLFPLVPLGIGTGQAESLTSYVLRLAEAHCLSVTTFYSLILHPAVRAEAENQVPERSRIVLQGRHGITRSGHTWNGVSGVASCHVRALERLTGRKDLRLLTWLPWEAALSHHLRRQRAWCPACFDQWRNEGQTVYEPLLWTLQIVSICPLHHCPLAEVCPSCQRKNDLLGHHARAGYCSHCRQRLNGTRADRLPFRQQAEKEQLRIAASAAEMIARAPELPHPPAKALLRQNLKELINYLGGSCKAFGEAIGRGHTVIATWRDGCHVPRLETLMEICHRLHLPLVDFLTVPLALRTAPSEMRDLFFPARASCAGQKPDPQEEQGPPTFVAAPPLLALPKQEKDRRIGQLLERELAKECPRSVAALATEVGDKSAGMIYKNFPDLARSIIAKRKENKERGRGVMTEALTETPLPTMKEIAARVGCASAEALYRHFPPECQALSRQRAQLEESRRVERETNLRAALRAEPPRPLRHIAARYGYSLSVLYGHHNELCHAISARHAAYQKEETPNRRRALKERIHQLMVDLQPSGNNPCAEQIKWLAPELRLSTIKRILREIEGAGPE